MNAGRKVKGEAQMIFVFYHYQLDDGKPMDYKS